MGSSQPWPEAMLALTGQRKFKADSLMDYFKPLHEFLVAENKKLGVKVGWNPECPSGYFKDSNKHDKDHGNGAGYASLTAGVMVVCMVFSILM